MAGLIVGLLLLRRGFEVTIFERSGDELSSRGAGITPHADLFAAFTEAGIDISRAMGVESQGRLILDRAGESLARLASQQTFTSWGLLYRILRDAFPLEHYRNGCAVKRIYPADSEVELTLDDGTSERFSWVIGADGVRSRTRRFVSPKTTLQELDYVAWRGLVEESAIEPATRNLLERGMTFFLPPGEHMLGYTVGYMTAKTKKKC